MIDDPQFQRFAKKFYGYDCTNPLSDSTRLAKIIAHYLIMPKDWLIRDNS